MRGSRKHPRIETDALLDFTGTNVLLYHRIENISLGGINIQAAEIEDVGTIVDLSINFPDLNETIDIKGEVVWANYDTPRDMGIKFIDLTSQDKAILKRYIEKRHEAMGRKADTFDG